MKRVGEGLFLTLMAFVVGGFLAACGGDDGTGPNGGDGNGNGAETDSATVAGAIDTLTARSRFLTTSTPQSGSDAGQQEAPEPDSIFAGTPRSNGNIEIESKDEVTDPDAFSINVPAGRRNLVIAIAPAPPRSDSVHLGRVLVFERSSPEAQIATEPLNMETTLEGAVFMRANFGNLTIPRGMFNNPQIGLLHRLPDELARPAAEDTLRIRNFAFAYRSGQETLLRTFRSGLFDQAFDSTALNSALRSDAGQPYADARADGMGHQAAHDQFIQDAADVYVNQLGNPNALSVAWGAFGTKHDYMMASPQDQTEPDPGRLMMAKNLLAITTEIRRHILEGLDDSQAKTDVSTALDNILSAGMAATTMDDFKTDVMQARQDGVATLEATMGRDLDESAANLGAFIDATNSPAEIVQNLPTFMSDLESAESDATARALLLALMAGPGYQ